MCPKCNDEFRSIVNLTAKPAEIKNIKNFIERVKEVSEELTQTLGSPEKNKYAANGAGKSFGGNQTAQKSC